ncbi:MAG: GlsB/YeaQ/YmgE family stress response membrane protein [Bradyrhizobium sp.]|nr:GlsB/YeaQ/YmgE family stress response membrane protein [Bradyrhizobium sp.]
MAQIIWAIIVGAIAGSVAQWISPAPNNRKGIVLTIVLGIIGAEVATYLGRLLRLYGPDRSAGIIASIVGALIVLGVWHFIERSRQTLAK